MNKTHLNSFANRPGNTVAAALIQQIDNLSAEQARLAFDSMSGSPHAAASQIAEAIGRNFSATLATRTGSTGLSHSGSSTAGLKATKAPLYASLNPSLLTRSGALELRAIASHLMGDNDSPLSTRLAGQAASFTAAGTPLKRTALTLGCTLTAQLSRGLSAYADAAYEYRGAGQNAFQLTAGLRLTWQLAGPAPYAFPPSPLNHSPAVHSPAFEFCHEPLSPRHLQPFPGRAPGRL